MKYFKKIRFFAVFFLFSFANPSQQLRSVEAWEILFLNSWKRELVKASKQSISKDAWDIYSLAYTIDANTSMFQATGNVKYLERNLFYINSLISSSNYSKDFPKSQYKDNFKGWVNHSSPTFGDNGLEYPLYESFCWRYISNLLKIMFKSPKLLSNDSFKTEYLKILEFTETNIFLKWSSRGMNNIFRSNIHMSSHWAVISLNLFEITGELKYKLVFEEFVRKIKKQIETNPKARQAIQWRMSWDKSEKVFQDVSHGNAVVGAIIEIYQDGYAFSKVEINSLIYTFDKIIWKSKSVFSYSFDGTGIGTGWFTDGLIKLGRFDNSLQIRIEQHNIGRSTQFFGNGALNACYLINGKAVFPENI